MWGMAGKRVTDAEIERRVDVVLQMICEGTPRRLIHTELCAKWGVSGATIDEYSTRARKILRKMWDVNREDFVAEQLAALEHLAHLAAKGKQYSAAAGARATMARLTGTDAPRQGAHNRKPD
jgi:hypothetical protein